MSLGDLLPNFFSSSLKIFSLFMKSWFLKEESFIFIYRTPPLQSTFSESISSTPKRPLITLADSSAINSFGGFRFWNLSKNNEMFTQDIKIILRTFYLLLFPPPLYPPPVLRFPPGLPPLLGLLAPPLGSSDGL